MNAADLTIRIQRALNDAKEVLRYSDLNDRQRHLKLLKAASELVAASTSLLIYAEMNHPEDKPRSSSGSSSEFPAPTRPLG